MPLGSFTDLWRLFHAKQGSKPYPYSTQQCFESKQKPTHLKKGGGGSANPSLLEGTLLVEVSSLNSFSFCLLPIN